MGWDGMGWDGQVVGDTGSEAVLVGAGAPQKAVAVSGVHRGIVKDTAKTEEPGQSEPAHISLRGRMVRFSWEQTQNRANRIPFISMGQIKIC